MNLNLFDFHRIPFNWRHKVFLWIIDFDCDFFTDESTCISKSNERLLIRSHIESWSFDNNLQCFCHLRRNDTISFECLRMAFRKTLLHLSNNCNISTECNGKYSRNKSQNWNIELGMSCKKGCFHLFIHWIAVINRSPHWFRWSNW